MTFIHQNDLKTKGVHRINIVEFATELAHERIVADWKNEPQSLYVKKEGRISKYNEDAQEQFDEYYDHYYSMIQDLTI